MRELRRNWRNVRLPRPDRGSRLPPLCAIVLLAASLALFDGCAADRGTRSADALPPALAPAIQQPGLNAANDMPISRSNLETNFPSGPPAPGAEALRVAPAFRLVSHTEELGPPAPPVSPNPPALEPAAIPAQTVERGRGETLPIDLPTALRLVSANNPTVALARERAEEATFRVQQANVLWLPDLRAGPTYDRFDGRDQATDGSILNVSKQNLFVGGGADLAWNTSELLFAPLAARQAADAQSAAARAVDSDAQLDAASTYLDLLHAYGALAINADTLARVTEMLRSAEAADAAGLSKTTADINRARAEAALRLNEKIQLEGKVAVISARLAHLLMLQPTVVLKPAEAKVVPIALVSEAAKLDDLIITALSSRPELRESRALVAAAATRWRQARLGPLLPHLGVAYAAGTFGGGIDANLNEFGSQGVGQAQMYWELHNLGAGDAATSRVREAQVNEANFNVAENQANVAEEVTAAFRVVETDWRGLESAQQAVAQSLETWRRLRAASFGLAGAEHQFDPLQPLIAERDLADARNRYLSAVIDYNKSQFRLYWALGQPPLGAPADMKPRDIGVPVVPNSPAPAEVVPAPLKVR